MKLDIADNTTVSLLPHLQKAIPFVHAAVDSGGRVLVHCASGSSRSGAIATAFAAWYSNQNVDTVLQELKAVRPIVLPNPGFMEQLHSFAASHWIEMGPSRLLLNAMNETTATPGGVLAIHTDKGSWIHAFGLRCPSCSETTADTIYDLASLTKVLSTASIAARLVDSRLLKLGTRVCDVIPEFGSATPKWRTEVTVEHLMKHESGLSKVMMGGHHTVTSKKQLIELVCSSAPIDTKPGSARLYTDLGFILLGEVLERLTGKPLDILFDHEVAQPLKLQSTTFHPSVASRERIAPTILKQSIDPNGLVGEVHDWKARGAGGVAGHAGLFGTASDVVKIGVGWCCDSEWISAETRTLFVKSSLCWSKAGKGETRNSQAGTLLNPDAFGHTGFTGTMIWCDGNVVITLLTNRVCSAPGKGTAEEILLLRRTVMDEIVRMIG